MSTPEESRLSLRIGHEANRYYGLEKERAERIRERIEGAIIRMLRVTDITSRQEVRKAWETISDLGKIEDVDEEHLIKVLNLVGGGQPRIPLLAKVWGIINICQATLNLTHEQKTFKDMVWKTVREIITTDPDHTNISQIVMSGAWIVGLVYREDESDVRRHRFQEISNSLGIDGFNADSRYGSEAAAIFLDKLLDVDKLKMGILTVKIQGGDQQQPDYEGKDIKRGYPDTMMILREGSLHSLEKLQEGVAIGVPNAGYLFERTLKVMIGLQREILADTSRVNDYPDRHWSFIAPGAYVHAKKQFDSSRGEFEPDGLTLWVALQAISTIKGKILPQVNVRNAVTSVVRKLQDRIEVKFENGKTQNAPGILRVAVNEWRDHSGERLEEQGINDFDVASEQLINSAIGLITAAGKPEKDNEFLVSGRPEIFEAYKKGLWESVPLEDKLEFVKILFKEGSSHFEQLSKGDKILYHLVTNPDLWDQQTREQQLEMARVLFEDRTKNYAEHMSNKWRSKLRKLMGEELAQERWRAIEYDIRRLRGNMLIKLQRELTIKAETIRDKGGEPIFDENEGKSEFSVAVTDED